MKFSESWLHEWVNPELSRDDLVQQLTMAGLEVDGIEAVAAEFDHVIVGEVIEVEPHPDADRLSLCKVNVKEKAPLDIVCGAANVRAGLKVAVAMIGATLPGGLKIKKSKLRGANSEGMLCSATELGLAESANGIIELAKDAPVGTDLREYLHLNDVSIAIDLTPNRGDCLSILGVAREIAALNAIPLNEHTVESVVSNEKPDINVTLSAPDACSRYFGRVFHHINTHAETPVWMQEHLRRSGVRCISPVVDVTNYVMLELGQPMHAFDLSKIDGDINVRYATQKETMTLLDGTEIALDEKSLVIADAKKPLAFAGIMGGKDSGVTDTTQDILLECAYFFPECIARSVRKYGLHTDGSHRWERGVDPDLQMKAIERATQLLLDIVGGRASDIIHGFDEAHHPSVRLIQMRPERANQILSLSLSAEEMANMLKRLGMAVFSRGQCLEVQVPSYRNDIRIEVDLIEEIARLYGYDKLPSSISVGTLESENLKPHQLLTRAYQQILRARAYHEAINYSFVDPKIQKLMFPDHKAFSLQNPISPELSEMRLNLWPSLLSALMHNQRRQQERVRLFEVGHCFDEQDGIVTESNTLAGIVSGSLLAQQWGQGEKTIDFYDIKSDVLALLSLTIPSDQLEVKSAEHEALHPGQSAVVMHNNRIVARLGALHPRIEAHFELQGPIFLFEIYMDYIQSIYKPSYKPVSKFPSIRRDISFLVDENVTAQALLDTVKSHSPDIVKEFLIFDVYQGEHVEKGKKSIALGFILHDATCTLIDSEINDIVNKIIDGLKKIHHIKLRD